MFRANEVAETGSHGPSVSLTLAKLPCSGRKDALSAQWILTRLQIRINSFNKFSDVYVTFYMLHVHYRNSTIYAI